MCIESNQLSNKQILWRKRSQLFWRIKGLYIPQSNNYITDEEKVLIDKINDAIKELNDNYTNNSIKLGFNAKHRCWCGNVGTNKLKDRYYCDSHIDKNYKYENS